MVDKRSPDQKEVHWLFGFVWAHSGQNIHWVIGILSSCFFQPTPFSALSLFTHLSLRLVFSPNKIFLPRDSVPLAGLQNIQTLLGRFFDRLAPFDVQFLRCFCSLTLRESFVLSNTVPKYSDKPAEFYVGVDEMQTVVREQENCTEVLEVLGSDLAEIRFGVFSPP